MNTHQGWASIQYIGIRATNCLHLPFIISFVRIKGKLENGNAESLKEGSYDQQVSPQYIQMLSIELLANRFLCY
jgi:hypothetical protein